MLPAHTYENARCTIPARPITQRHAVPPRSTLPAAPTPPGVQCLSAAQVQAAARSITVNNSWALVPNCIEYTSGKQASWQVAIEAWAGGHTDEQALPGCGASTGQCARHPFQSRGWVWPRSEAPTLPALCCRLPLRAVRQQLESNC